MSLATLKTRIEAAFAANGIDSFGYIWSENELNNLANQTLPYYGLILQNGNIANVENTNEQFINYRVVLLLADNLHQSDRTQTATNRHDYWWTKMASLESLTFSLLDNVSDFPNVQVQNGLEFRHIPYSSDFNLCAIYATFEVAVSTNFCVH